MTMSHDNGTNETELRVIQRDEALASSKPRPKLLGIDAMRFYAAAMIVLFHLAYLARIEIPTYLNFIKFHFAIGVPLFFLVSAFGLTLGYRGRINTSDELRDYFSRRFWRIAPFFYFIILVTLAVQFFSGAQLTGWVEILMSVLFVFNMLPQYVTGFVAASWSIGVEMLFYCLLPLLLYVVTNLRRALVFWIFAVVLGALWGAAFDGASVALKPFGQKFLLSYLQYFAAGFFSYFAFIILYQKLTETERKITGIVLFVVGLMIFCATVFAAPTIISLISMPGYLVARTIALSSLVVGVALCRIPGIVSETTVRWGKASFGIYLWHPIIIVVFYRVGIYEMISEVVSHPGVVYAIAALITFSVLMPLSLAGYKFIERPGMHMARGDFSWSTFVLNFSEPWRQLFGSADYPKYNKKNRTKQ